MDNRQFPLLSCQSPWAELLLAMITGVAKVITGEATDDERNDPDIAQRFHLNNSQATLHYFVAYFISSEELYHMNYVDTSGV